MKIVIVYGCPCSGKSSYVGEHLRQNDIVYDYDRLLAALTYKENHTTEKHAAHEIILQIRWIIIHKIKDMPDDGTAFIISRWPDATIKQALEGLDVTYKLIEATKAECFQRLQNDASRVDKEGWKKIIADWFNQHTDELRGATHMKELRYCEIRAEAAAGAETLRIEGRPIVYDQPTTINDPAGAYIEIIRAGALDGADLSDARLLYNHDLSKVPLARTPKTMQLIRDSAGLRMVADLPDTAEARSVYTAVQRGDLSGMSFAFKVPEEGNKYNAATKTREIFKIDKVYEVSIVPFPAYQQTSVEARRAIDRETNTARLREQAVIAANTILMKEV